MTRADAILIGLLALVALAAWPIAASASGGDASCAVVTSPAGSSEIALEADTVVTIEGEFGPVTLEIRGGEARVVHSGCPDQTCVLTGAVSAPGAVIACVPNHVVVRIGGSEDDALDARVR